MHALAQVLNFNNLTKFTISLIIVALLTSVIFTYTLFPKKQTQALFGLADFTFTTETFSFHTFAMQLLEALVRAFLTKMINRVMGYIEGKISQYFIIKNFLYYKDVLSDRRYLTDYLLRYIPSAQGRAIVRRIINDFQKGGRGFNFGDFVFYSQQAQAYLGYDRNNLQANDPEYYAKLISQGDLWSTEIGQYFAYIDKSFSAKGSSDEAATTNMTSHGYKTSFAIASEQQAFQAKQQVGLTESIVNGIADAMFDSVNPGGGGLATALGSFIGSMLADFLGTKLSCGRIYEEGSQSYGDRGASLNIGNCADVSTESTGGPRIPQVPDFCSAAVSGSVRTDLGEATAIGGDASGTGGSATGGSGGMGGDGSGGSGGDASGGDATATGGSIEFDLNNGSMTAGVSSSTPCAYFSPSQAEQGFRDMDADYMGDY